MDTSDPSSVLALPLLKRDQRDLFGQRVLLDRRDEPFADRIHQRRRRERLPPMRFEEPRRSLGTLQPGYVRVEVHPIDPLQLEGHVLFQNLAHSMYAHGRLQLTCPHRTIAA